MKYAGRRVLPTELELACLLLGQSDSQHAVMQTFCNMHAKIARAWS